MYEINVSTRRVTQYIMEEAYKWLYRKVMDGEYRDNRSMAGKKLLVQIQADQCVTPENYEQFVELMDNSPYSYMMYRGRKRASRKITTDSLLNYFIKFNGQVLPLGFVKDFFEDDYETEQEINVLLEKFMDAENNAINVQWRSTLINKEETLENARGAFPNLFRIHPMLIVTQCFRLFFTGLLIATILSFLSSVGFWDVMGRFVSDNSFDMKKEFVAEATMSAYCYDGYPFCIRGNTFTLGEYFGHYGFYFVLCIVAIIFLIPRLKQAISFLMFALRILYNRVRGTVQKWMIHLFERKGVESIGNYFREVAPDMVAARAIEDSHCAGIPKLRHVYNAIEGFNVQKMREKLAALNPKYYSKNYAYEEKDLATVKAVWKKGLVPVGIVTLLLAVILFPPLSKLIMPGVMNLINSIF